MNEAVRVAASYAYDPLIGPPGKWLTIKVLALMLEGLIDLSNVAEITVPAKTLDAPNAGTVEVTLTDPLEEVGVFDESLPPQATKTRTIAKKNVWRLRRVSE